MSAGNLGGRQKVVEGLELPVPNAGTISHAIIRNIRDGWNKTAEILTGIPPEITENFRSIRVILCQLTKKGYLERELPNGTHPGTRQRYAPTERGRAVRNYIINQPARPAVGSNRQDSGPTTSG